MQFKPSKRLTKQRLAALLIRSSDLPTYGLTIVSRSSNIRVRRKQAMFPYGKSLAFITIARASK